MLLSEIGFVSFLAYSVHGDDDVAKESKYWRSALKGEWSVGSPRREMSLLVAQRLAAQITDTPLAGILSKGAVLIPIPSTRLLQPGSLWVPQRLAAALVGVGLGRSVEACLVRTRALSKAAWSRAIERPTAQQHYDTLSIQDPAFISDEIVLIDDVVTRGATFLGAASRVRERFPGAKISCVAVMRSVSDRVDFTTIRDPRVGRIHLRSDGQTARRP